MAQKEAPATKDMNKVLWLVGAIFVLQTQALNSVWRWECVNGYCEKKQITDENDPKILSLAECRLICSKYSALWPIPTGGIAASKELVVVDGSKIEVNGLRTSTPISKLAKLATDAFKSNVADSSLSQLTRSENAGLKLVVSLAIEDQDSAQLDLETDEGYTLKVDVENGNIVTNITAKTFYGARHGLETLGQLIVHDDLRDLLKMPKQVSVQDTPAYPHRGILLDTSRNYVSVDTIKKTLNGMGASKLNAFHWHITDSQSFPYQSKSLPELSKTGAYSPRKVYTAEDIADIIEFGKSRGVKIIPEFDAPAHVGEGWQNSGFLTCFNAQPWTSYCVEPPCGQFDPTKDKLYDALESLYGDMLEQFQPDIFHMGGDEVHFGCWNSTQDIVDWLAKQGIARNEEGFVKLWNVFQTKALERLYKKAGKEIPVVMWTSTLTQKEYLHYLPKDKYIIQIWTTGHDPQVTNLLNNDYKLILSNYDALYLDCGFAGWVTDGNNWCSPYIGWQKVYENSPQKIAGEKKKQILGAEATLWTEQADDSSIDNRLWPRAAAMAEQLWSEPKTGWREAEQRMLVQRERLVKRGIAADTLEPEWCRQNEENCPMRGKFIDI